MSFAPITLPSTEYSTFERYPFCSFSKFRAEYANNPTSPIATKAMTANPPNIHNEIPNILFIALILR